MEYAGKSKDIRRSRIIKAAENLIRRDNSVSFSMNELAKMAGLSYMTTYNLIGNKGSVLYTLLNRCIDEIVRISPAIEIEDDVLDRLLTVADSAADFYAADPVFFQPLLRFLFGVQDDVHRDAFMNRGWQYWTNIATLLKDSGYIQSNIRPSDFGRYMNTFFAGALFLWSHGSLDRHAFRTQIKQGMAIGLLSFEVAEWRNRLMAEIAKTYDWTASDSRSAR